MVSKNKVTFKAVQDTFIMTIPMGCNLSNTIHMNVAMKIYTYMLMYNHMKNAKEAYNITTTYDAVHIDFHHISVHKTMNIPVEHEIIVKCDTEDYKFNQYMIDQMFATQSGSAVKSTEYTTHTSGGMTMTPPSPEPLVLRHIPLSYDIYNESMEPYGYCNQNLSLDFTPTQFRA